MCLVHHGNENVGKAPAAFSLRHRPSRGSPTCSDLLFYVFTVPEQGFQSGSSLFPQHPARRDVNSCRQTKGFPWNTAILTLFGVFGGTFV